MTSTIVVKTSPSSAAETEMASSRSSRSHRYPAEQSATMPKARNATHAEGTCT